MRRLISDFAFVAFFYMLLFLMNWTWGRASLYGTYLSNFNSAGMLLGVGISYVVSMSIASGKRRYLYWAFVPVIVVSCIVGTSLSDYHRALATGGLSGSFNVYACMSIAVAIILGAMAGWSVGSLVGGLKKG